MTKEALKLAAEMERGQFSTTLLPAAAELRRLHEENQKLRAQLALDRKAENARELGLDYEPEQEPVAVVVSTSRTDDGFRAVVETGDELLDLDTLLYTTPPQRTWVGLTDKDWNRSKHNYDFQKGADWAESILKEKNA